MKHLLLASALIEVGAAAALFCCPSAMAMLLLGSPLEAPVAVSLGRLCGAALLALSVACWLAMYDVQSCAARGVVSAMVIYNFGAVAIFVIAALSARVSGIALWPAVALHAAMGIWCIAKLVRTPAGIVRHDSVAAERNRTGEMT
jgi:hypothetical protein